jgi:hypothetical protein
LQAQNESGVGIYVDRICTRATGPTPDEQAAHKAAIRAAVAKYN